MAMRCQKLLILRSRKFFFAVFPMLTIEISELNFKLCSYFFSRRSCKRKISISRCADYNRLKRDTPAVSAVRMKYDENDVKIYCPSQSCGKFYKDVKNWRKHFREKHGSMLDEEDDIEERLHEAEAKIKKRMGDLITRMEAENDGLKTVVNRLLKIRASRKLKRRSIQILLRNN